MRNRFTLMRDDLVVAHWTAGSGAAELVVTTYGITDGVLVEKSRGGLGVSCGAPLLGFGTTPMVNLAATTHDFDDDARDEVAIAYRCNDQIAVVEVEALSTGTRVVQSWRSVFLEAGDDSSTFARLELAGGHPEIAAVRSTSSIGAPEHRLYVAFTELPSLRTGQSAPVARLVELETALDPRDPIRGLVEDIRLGDTFDQTPSVMPSLTVSDSDLDGVADVQVAYNELRRCFAPLFGLACDASGLVAETLHIVHVRREDGPASFDRDPRVEDRLVRRIAPPPSRNVPWEDVERFWGAPVIVAADFDADSVRLRATGEVLRRTSTPHINALLAAAPTWLGRDDIVQDGDSGTAFGTASSEGVGESRQVSAGASATVTVGADFLIAEVSESTTLSYEYTRENGSETTVTVAMERSNGPEDDMVVYRVTPFASHVYEIVAHPNASLIGTTMTLDVPGRTLEISQDLTRFRQHYGDLADKLVPPDLFTHLVGDPSTYARPADCGGADLASRVAGIGSIDNAFASEIVDVGNSTSGSTSLSVSVGEQTSSSESTTLGVEQSFSAEVAGTGGEVSASLTYGWTSTVTMGSEVSYAGSVAHMAGSIAPADRYSWGLCVYTYTATDASAAYPVIDYVVEM